MVTATKVGRYEIVGELGRGGMGVVYEATDPVIGRTVAVKTIRLSEEGSGMSHAQLVQRFQTEARAAGLLAHPNIVVIYDAGEDHNLYYITMELVRGKSLQSWLDSGEKFLLPRVLRIMEQVCSALQFAHDRSVVHRDIKPANIMMTADDSVKVTDFGTAKILQYGAAHQTAATGTPGYMSPEQIKGRAVDGRADIFSLGVMLYEMMTGKKPFTGQDIAAVFYRILNEQPVPPQSIDPSIHPGVSSTIMKALAKSPNQRYQSCAELLEDLRNYRPGGRSVAPPDPQQLRPAAASPRIAEARKTTFTADMPQIPGLQTEMPKGPEQEAPSESAVGNLPEIKRLVPWAIGIAIVALVGFFGVRTILHSRQTDSTQTETAAQTPTTTSEQSENQSGPPMVSERNPEIATLRELAAPWSSKEFRFRAPSASAYVPALIIRLPGPATLTNSYWAFSLAVPFRECRYEYIVDLTQLSADYQFRAKHPMVGNPCSHAVLDPLQLKETAGNILVRGAIVQGWDTRPPYGIELKVTGNHIQALRLE